MRFADATIDIHGNPSESITSFSDEVLDSGDICVQVSLGKGYVLSSSIVHSLGSFKVLLSPCIKVSVGNVGGVCERVLICGHVWLDGLGLERRVGGGSERSRDVSTKSINSLVPHSVQFVGFVVIGKFKCVSSFITFGVVIVIASHGVEGLGDVTHIMDKKP
jgi:hypothetical protein